MKRQLWVLLLSLGILTACTRRDFLTRGSAAEIISSSTTFQAPEQFWLRTGVISNKDYLSPEYLVLQHRGWLTGVNVPCPPDIAPVPCWDVALTPAGVDVFRDLISGGAAVSRYFSVATARRELVAVTGISKAGNFADVEFTWKWVPLNEVGAALESAGVHHASTVAFRHYDDGWRVIEGVPRSNQTLEDALKNAQAVQ